jgi:hypothetical protein
MLSPTWMLISRRITLDLVFLFPSIVMLFIFFEKPQTFSGIVMTCAKPLMLAPKLNHKKLKNKKSRILFLMRQR